MKIDILTLFPQMFPPILDESILGRAQEKGILDFKYHNIRDYSKDKHKRVDDYPYGGGPGMVMAVPPLYDAYKSITEGLEHRPYVVAMSPRGQVFNQQVAKELSGKKHIVIICGHYEGLDQRVYDELCDQELSIGDFVLTGGELGAMVVADAVARLVPGVLAGEESYTSESHYDGLLEHPQYTRPEVFRGERVPEVLLGGNHAEISSWRTKEALKLTYKVRPDLYDKLKDKPQLFTEPPLEKVDVHLLAKDGREAEEICFHCRKLGIELLNGKEYKEGDALIILGNIPFMGDALRIFNMAETAEGAYSQRIKEINGIGPDRIYMTPAQNARRIYDYVKALRLCKTAKGRDDGFLASLLAPNRKCQFRGAVPYGYYENNFAKFEGFVCEDLSFISQVELPQGDVTLFRRRGNCAYVAEGRLSFIKCKGHRSRLPVVAVEGLGSFLRYSMANTVFGGEVYVLKGRHGRCIYDYLQREGVGEIHFPLGREGWYPDQNPFE